jgi:DNA-binding NarL/FixJ family response regulator
VARVLVLTGDLLFGSRLQGALGAAGHSVELLGARDRLERAIADPAAQAPGALIVDLTDEQLDGGGVYASLAGQLEGVRSLGFYSHVDLASREAGEAAGIALVVPRSRIAREAPELVERLLGAGAG